MDAMRERIQNEFFFFAFPLNKSVIINLSLQQFIVDSLTIENAGTMGLSAEKELAEILQKCWDASYQTLQAQTTDFSHF